MLPTYPFFSFSRHINKRQLSRQHFHQLLKKYLSNIPFDEEEDALWNSYMRDDDCIRVLQESIREHWTTEEVHTVHTENEKQEEYRKLMSRVSKTYSVGRNIRLWIKVGSVAAITFIIGAAALFYNYRHIEALPVSISKDPIKKDVMLPGGNGAILILDNGSKIALDSSSDGLVQGNKNSFTFLNTGKEIPESVRQRNESTLTADNTLLVPKGNRYMIQLVDGSKIWLNSGTTIKFPTAFTEKERKIQVICGEVYLEVVHHDTWPFRIQVNDQIVEDIGTQFDIQAYDDDQVTRTTLVEGAVSVTSRDRKKLLQPGQQLQLFAASGLMYTRKVNVDDVVAWKNGFFSFENAPLQQITKQLSRWYDVDIVCQHENLNDHLFSGRLDRSLSLDKVLKGLLNTKAKFTIDENNRKVIILP